MVAVVVVEGLAIALLGMLVVGLLRSHADILRSLHELGAGLALDDEAPSSVGPRAPRDGAFARPTRDVPGNGPQAAHDVEGTTVEDETAAVAVVGTHHDTVLAFLSTTCLSCEAFWHEFAAPFALPVNTRLVVVVQDADSRSRLRRLAPPDLLVVRSDAAWQDYDVPGSPHFVHIDGPAGSVVGEGAAETWEQVRDLLDQARAGTIPEDPRDNAERIDRELLASGIGPGHPSLYSDVDDGAENEVPGEGRA